MNEAEQTKEAKKEIIEAFMKDVEPTKGDLPSVRIGVDVGGTFTHAVALESDSLKIIAKTKVPTSHRAKEGVAKGIVEALQKLLKEADLKATQVTFIAHSTTQATNALLEGDVAKVGILALGGGHNAWLIRQITNLTKVEVSPGKYIETVHKFIDTTAGIKAEIISTAIDELVEKGAQAIAISEGFAVDDPTNEKIALDIARAKNLMATAGTEVSQLYGLKVRTRTAIINASMLPKMIESANMTERSVLEAGIKAPVMIMRSDGGVMDIESMRKKPIMTMLSGPAAGVAAATMFLRISDGIFLEVGGTSTDISTIKDGRALVKSGEIGGNKVYMRTLDVRTLGVAGGSMYRIKGTSLIDVGPRSAHIAGLDYVSFSEPAETIELKTIKPLENDQADYLAFAYNSDEKASVCLTPTCAANFLNLVPHDNCAAGNLRSIRQAIKKLSARLLISEEETAEKMEELAVAKCIPVVQAMLKEYKLDPEIVTLIGGGGGAAAIVPFLAKKLNMRFRIAEHADVISAIGVAMALIRETIEKQIVKPSKEDILLIRSQAAAAVAAMGADQKTVEVHLEIDSRTNSLRATAYGASSSVSAGQPKQLTIEEQAELAANSMRVPIADISLAAKTHSFVVYTAEPKYTKFFGLLKSEKNCYRVLDIGSGIRLQSQNGIVTLTSISETEEQITKLIEKYSSWGDAGQVIPQIVLLAGAKIIDLSGLLDSEQVVAVARTELEAYPSDEVVVVLTKLS